jgi:hypothetical protein
LRFAPTSLFPSSNDFGEARTDVLAKFGSIEGIHFDHDVMDWNFD